MDKAKCRAMSLAFGFVAVVFYLISLLWHFFLTVPALEIVHIQILEIVFPGFVWMSFASFLWGLFLSFLYGFLAARIYILVYKFCCAPDEEIKP